MAVGLTAVVLAAVGCTKSKPAETGEPEQRAYQPTAWDTVMALTPPSGEVSKEQALQAFSLVYGPLPGVTVPAEAPAPVRSGTGVTRMVREHWAGLTQAQRDAVNSLVPFRIEAPAQASMPTLGRSSGVKAVPAYFECDEDAKESYVEAPDHVYQLAIDLAKKAAGKLNVAELKRDELKLCRATKAPPAPSPSGAKTTLEGVAAAGFEGGKLYCAVDLTQSSYGTAPMPNLRSDVLQRTLMHEMVHCLQARLVPAGDWGKIPLWVGEGTADWVAHTLVPGLPSFWFNWITQPTLPIHFRSYDAFGFFQHIEHITGNAFAAASRTVSASVKGGKPDSEGAYLAAIADAQQLILDTLPSSFASFSKRGAPIRGHGPWAVLPPGGGYYEYGAERPSPELLNDGEAPALANGYGSNIISPNITADIVQIRLGGGTPRGRFGTGVTDDMTLAEALTKTFCTLGDACKCPDDKPLPMQVTKIDRGKAHLAITALGQVEQAVLKGMSITKYCKEQPKPCRASASSSPRGCDGTGGGQNGSDLATPQPKGKCKGASGGTQLSLAALAAGPKCAATNGDPHLLTFDEKHYDLQSVGEFTLVKSTMDSMEIQVRQAPVPGWRSASLNTAVAARVGSERVGIYLEGSGLTVTGNGKVLREGPFVGVQWPDESQMWVSKIGHWGIKIELSLAPERNGKITGLMGNADGSPDNDLSTRDGQVLPPVLTHEELHGTFGHTWRITQAESLFDYGPGQNTATFTDLSFPSEELKPERVPNRSAAEQACREAGVTDPKLLQDCIMDVALTGQKEFATATAGTQRFLAGTTQTVTGTVIQGDLNTPGEADRYEINVEGTELYLAGFAGLLKTCSDLDVDVDAATARAGAKWTCGTVRHFRFAQPGRYTLVVHSKSTGDYRFEVVPVRVTVKQMSLGTPIQGALGRGEVHRYEFEAAGLSKIAVSGLPASCNVKYILDEASFIDRMDTLRNWNNLCTGESTRDLTMFTSSRQVLLLGTAEALAEGSYSLAVTPA